MVNSIFAQTNRFLKGSPRFHTFSASIRGWEQMIFNTSLGAGAVVDNDDDSEDE